jgi:RecB family exonuclease
MQQRRLIRARGLATFRRALVDLALDGEPLAARRRVVLVPTRASGELLRQTIETAVFATGSHARVLPDFLTRDQWLARLHEALPGAGPMLSEMERVVLFERAARSAGARARMGGAPFRLRAGLIASMIDFYDELGRRQRRIRRFAQVLFEQLRVERGMDRGSEGLIHQTAFLAFACLGYQRAVAASGRMDEHELRRELLARQPVLPFDHLVLAVADHPSDPRGLWPADFDLVGRLATLSRLDVVMTDETHDAGFRERLEQELPRIVESRVPDAPRAPVLITPNEAPADPVFVSRDREDELRDVTRAIRRRAHATGSELRESVAIVFHRRLPYLYLGQHVLADGGVPYQAFDAMPLGAEPYAALLDQVLAVARTGGTREAAVSLLRSSLVRFEVDQVRVGRRDASALDAVLGERRATGDAATYVGEVDAFFGDRLSRHGLEAARARRAARAAADMREALLPFRDAGTASAQVAALSGFLRAHERLAHRSTDADDRRLRARAAVLSVLDDLVHAFDRHDDQVRDEADLTAVIHHAIEARTFSPLRGEGGVHLVDVVAARFGEFDHVHLVGLVETDWPERVRRSIFYTGSLLSALGWPQESDQMLAQQATFRDLLSLARRTTSLHAFQLEGDAIVALSPLVDAARDWSSRRVEAAPVRAVFGDELLMRDWEMPLAIEAGSAAWLDLRRRRPALDDAAYSGLVGAQPPQVYRVSRVDRYVDCPFKYFSESVLQLAEERDESAGLTPLERGTLMHSLFERFYQTWQGRGHGTITAQILPEALTLFGEIAREALAGLPGADAALEEARLLGSIVDRGVAERVFELEVDAGGQIARRLLEVDIRGPFQFPQLSGLVQQRIDVRGKADRIDVFEDGSLRVIDYKLGRLPDVDRSIQIGVYAHCARQQLHAADGRAHPVQAAMYLAFGDDRRFDGRLETPGEKTALAVETRASAFAATIARIEAGVFPPAPHRPGECAWCGYAGVCRKEYQAEGEGDDAAEPV